MVILLLQGSRRWGKEKNEAGKDANTGAAAVGVGHFPEDRGGEEGIGPEATLGVAAGDDIPGPPPRRSSGAGRWQSTCPGVTNAGCRVR